MFELVGWFAVVMSNTNECRVTKLNDAEQRDMAPDLGDQHTVLNPAHPDDTPLTIDELAFLGLRRSPTRISSNNSHYGSPIDPVSRAHAGLSGMEYDLSARHDTGDVLHNGSAKLASPINSIPSLPQLEISAEDEAPAAVPERAGTGEAIGHDLSAVLLKFPMV
jgi:hypothetical protein